MFRNYSSFPRASAVTCATLVTENSSFLPPQRQRTSQRSERPTAYVCHCGKRVGYDFAGKNSLLNPENAYFWDDVL
jgi:hypothetical protein